MIHPRETFSLLQSLRRAEIIALPHVLEKATLKFENKEALGAVADHEDIERLFPKTFGRPRIALSSNPLQSSNSPGLKVGVVLSGGQAPGGHNVIAGVYDFVMKISPDSSVIGFLDGPQGIYNGEYSVLTHEVIDSYRNSGGFDMIGSGRHKIEKIEHFKAAMANCTALDLDGLVVIGGDDSNTNAALLAEYFEANQCKTKVCGAPKTIDGDLKVHPYIPISFGFDSACRTYSELIGNLGHDTLSSKKYYHFVRLMGRAASNIALECALLTRPTVCLISEEIEQKQMTLSQITHYITEIIVKRSEGGKDYGIVLLPEGLIEFIPEFNALISEINEILSSESMVGIAPTDEIMLKELSFNNRAIFAYLPDNIKQQLLLDRDPHGNVQVAKIETEKLLAQTVAMELQHLQQHGKYKGDFSPQFHSYGYEGRSCLPSVFDATYCYALGQTAGGILSQGLNGYICSVTNLTAPVSEWECGGVPITMMCHMERRHGHMKPVIKKALVELDGQPFACFSSQRGDWAKYDLFRNPGPIQFIYNDGSAPYIAELPVTLTLELTKQDSRMRVEDMTAIKSLQDHATITTPFHHAPLTGEAVKSLSQFQRDRSQFKPQLCPALRDLPSAYSRCVSVQPTQCMNISDRNAMMHRFPLTYGASLLKITPEGSSQKVTRGVRVGVVFCGRQSPGAQDIIAGLLDSLPEGSSLFGFVGGTEGLLSNNNILIDAEVIKLYRGQGGFDLLCRTYDKLEKEENFRRVGNTCLSLTLDGLLMIGASRTATDAAYLTEFFLSQQEYKHICVITVPVAMNGSIKNDFVETTVGFDTAAKVTAQIVGNNATDGASAKKYYYFQRLMGQEPSHLALEVALQTHPNYTLLAEEVQAKNITLADIVKDIADMVETRANNGLQYGSVVIPEGLIESIPELRMLLQELDTVYEDSKRSGQKITVDILRKELTLWSRALLDSLPDYLQAQLMLERSSTTNLVKLSQTETERLLAHFVAIELNYRKKKGTFKGSFSVISSFIGYQARGAAPSNFDINYAYNLGHVVSILIGNGVTGYMATIHNLKDNIGNWRAGGVPLTAMMQSTSHSSKLVIEKAHIDLSSAAYLQFKNQKSEWAIKDCYTNPGPIQFAGVASDQITQTLQLESFDYLNEVQSLYSALQVLTEKCRPGCSSTILQIATKNLNALTEIITTIHNAELAKNNV